MKDNFFQFNSQQLEGKIKTFITDNTTKINERLEKKMNAAIDIVYRTARTRRAMTGKGKDRTSIVGSQFGVPVQSGNLQTSIKKEVIKKGSTFIGRVYQDGSAAVYGKRIEYGFFGKDSLGRLYHQPPRPFMRPALNMNIEKIHNLFRSK